MIHINFKDHPVYLTEQLDAIKEYFNTRPDLCNISSEDLKEVILGTKLLIRSNDVWTLIRNSYDNMSDYPDNMNDCKLGAEIFPKELTNVIKPVTEINLDEMVFANCDIQTWYDISTLANKVEHAVAELHTFEDASLPTVTKCYAYKRLACAVNDLNDNGSYKEHIHDDGRLLRSLADIDYSLAGGWSPEMQDFIKEYNTIKIDDTE